MRTNHVKSAALFWSSIVAAVFSAAWVLLLAALVARAKLADQTFPVLAKFTPFHTHLVATDRMLQAFPVLAFLALVLAGLAWWRAGGFRAVRAPIFMLAASMTLSLFVIVADPGGYLSWFLS
jgi:hypothetical protein